MGRTGVSNETSAPHAYLVGAKVIILPEIKSELGLDWEDGIVVSCFDSERGVGLHVCNPETGAVTSAITLDAVKLHPDTVKILIATGNMVSQALKQVRDLFKSGSF